MTSLQVSWLLFINVFISILNAGYTQDAAIERENSSHFLLPPMPARIYAQAPSGVVVTKIKFQMNSSQIIPGISSHSQSLPNPVGIRLDSEVEFRRSAARCVPQYYLLDNQWTDYERFTIDRCSGTISTSKYVEKSVGYVYKVIVIANDHQNATIGTKEIKIGVCPYNSKPPELPLKHYTTEVLDASNPGTLVMTAVATDNDTYAENRELYFSLQPTIMPPNPWFRPITTPLIMNVTSGEIRVSDNSLLNCSSPLHFRVLVSDSGSPPRSDTSRLTIHIRNISAPRNVRIQNITKSSMKVCWSPPLHGTPEGYLVSYTSMGHGGSGKGVNDGGKLNLTIDELEEILNPAQNIQKMSVGIPGDSEEGQTNTQIPEELYSFFSQQFCTEIDGLAALTNYAISVRAWASNGRMSMARVPLTAITWRKNCNDVVCEHGVCQEKTASPGFTCLCSPGYYGQYCQLEDPCVTAKGNFACLNGGTCIRSEAGIEGLACICPSRHYGTYCQKVNPCIQADNPCKNGGTCSPNAHETFKCLCPPDKTGELCEIQDVGTGPEFWCKQEELQTAEGNFIWPFTQVGEVVSIPCPYGVKELQVELSSIGESKHAVYSTFTNDSDVALRRSTRSFVMPEAEVELRQFYGGRRFPRSLRFGDASRVCVEGSNRAAVWLEPDLSSCKTNDEVGMYIVNITSSKGLNSTTLATSVRQISQLVEGALKDRKVAQNMVSAVSNILSVNESLFEGSEISTNTSAEILATLDDYTSKVLLKVGERVKLSSNNLVVEVKLLHKDDLPKEVAFTPFSFEEKESGEHQSYDQEESWFTMPKSSLLQLSESNLQTDMGSDSSDHLRFKFISFNDDRLFRGQNHEKLNNPVLSASISNKNVHNLQTPVAYKIPIGTIDPFLETPVCVFWNATAHEWFRDGIVTKQNEKGETICETNHLTSFSVLLDPIGTPIMSDIKPFLSVITYIGIALSTVALAATVITFAIFSFNRDRSGLIVMNLAIALLLLNISFLVSQFITSNQKGCWLFGALLHYAVTASFAWMLIEAVNMYQLLVTVFPSSETHFMRKRVIVGWVTPLVFVFVALIWNKNVYFTEHQSICVISPISAPAVYYTTYLAPVCAVLAVNITVFFLVARVLCQSRPTYTRKIPVTLAQIRGAIAIVALLGITWLTGVFAVGHLRMVSQILFCFTTPFQGLIIFWVRVMQSADARMAWKIFLKTGSTRKRPQPLSSLRTHSSSHQASSFHTQSTGTTPQKSVYETALQTVRRLSSTGLGFIGSAKKFRSSTSSDGSTKKLNKKLSNDCEKQNKILTDDAHPTEDNLISKLQEPINKNDFSILTNGDMKVSLQEAYKNQINKEYSSSERNTPGVSEGEPMKELHIILDIKLDKTKLRKSMNSTEQINENYQEYIFSYLNTCREEGSTHSDNPKKISCSASNLSPIKTRDNKDCARSLESLLPTIGIGYMKTNTQLFRPTPNSDPKWKATSESSSKRTSSRRKLNKTDSGGDGSYDESVTKSASDSDINDLTVSTTSDWKPPTKTNLGMEESESYGTAMPEIALSSDPSGALSLGHRTNSELLLGPRADNVSFKRRSASISDLDFLDQFVPNQRFSSKAYL